MKTVRCASLLNVPYDTVTVTRTPWPFANGVCREVSDDDAARFAALPGFEVLEQEPADPPQVDPTGEKPAEPDAPVPDSAPSEPADPPQSAGEPVTAPADEPPVVVPVTTPVHSKRRR